jgi:hypothetical protein
MNEVSDSFYVVLQGQVGVYRGVDMDDQQSSKSILSGAGNVNHHRQPLSRVLSSKEEVREVMAFLQVKAGISFLGWVISL